MSIASVQTCNQLDFEGIIHPIQENSVHSVDICWNRYTNRWLQLFRNNAIHFTGHRLSQGKATPCEENN